MLLRAMLILVQAQPKMNINIDFYENIGHFQPNILG